MSPFYKPAKTESIFKRIPLWKKITSLHINLVLLAGIIFLGGTYLVQINSLAAKGFEIKHLENQIAELKDGNEKYTLQIAELKSLSRIEEAMKSMDMVLASGKPEYLAPASTAVAFNR